MHINSVFIFTLLLSGSLWAQTAVNHVVPASVTLISPSGCSPTACNGAIKAGDTITLAAGNRGRLTINDLQGTADKPIIVRNNSSANGPTVFRSTGGESFLLTIKSVNYLTLDGSLKWAGAAAGNCNMNRVCGIEVTIASGKVPTAFIKVSGNTKNFTMTGVEIDGEFPRLSPDGSGIGISINDHQYKLPSSVSQKNATEWRENIVLTNNYIHDIGSECLYVGPNYSTDKGADLPLRNINIAYNRVERCVRDGINLKSTIAGINRIHHNMLTDIGIGVGGSAPDRSGIAVFEGYADVYNNRVDSVYLNGSPGGNCYSIYSLNRPSGIYGPYNASIYNNVCFNAEKGGINVGRKSTAQTAVVPAIFNNTIVEPAERGISSDIPGAVIRDNIVAGAGATPVSGTTLINNLVGTTASMKFVGPTVFNFDLQAGSPARDKGSLTGCASRDIDDVLRPQGARCDQGAYEYVP